MKLKVVHFIKYVSINGELKSQLTSKEARVPGPWDIDIVPELSGIVATREYVDEKYNEQTQSLDKTPRVFAQWVPFSNCQNGELLLGDVGELRLPPRPLPPNNKARP